MSLRSLRDTLYSLTGSVPQDSQVTMDTEPVWVAAGDGVWSDGNGHGNGLFGWRSLASGLGFGHHSHQYHHHGVTDWRNLFFWLAVFAILILFAVITNPTESSFRAHLTELSFRRHLANIRRSETDEVTPLTDEQAQLPSTSPSAHTATPDRRAFTPGTGTETPTHTIAPFRFANHAEAARREAEKKLKSVEGIRDGLLSKISAAESEIKELKGNMENSEKNVRVIQEEGGKHVVLTQLNVEERKKEMDLVENEILEIENRNEDLIQLIKDAEERLKKIIEDGENARKIKPEEEMMMMAAAYEAAAQEGYLHSGYQPSHHGPSPVPPPPGPPTGGRGAQQDQWQSQAAAYMAEAGMPHLGYDYTARPAHSGSTGFGHLSKHPNPNSASSRDLESMRRPDISGFEDFGPGTAFGSLASHAHSQGNQINRSTTPQPPSDSESDIYGQDPGSPYGGFSSSNLLPQGLFRSLEGDQTPFVSGDEELPETFEEPLSFDLDQHHHHPQHRDPTESTSTDTTTSTSTTVSKLERQAEDLQVDSGSSDSDEGDNEDEDEDDWKSPLPEPKSLKETKESGYKRLSSSSASRLVPPAPTGSASPNTLSALPSLLPGSRRWFSGTGVGTLSNDNIPSTASTFGGFMHSTTSNDSLNLPGYENNPFAPTSSEKKALANKWGPFGTSGSDNKWASAFGRGSNNAKDNEDDPISNGWPITSPANGNGNENEGKKPFRFFSLRGKPTTGSTPP
ncbi:hypothetical protein V865_001562 [Kwoniella europaea PYCC6329]|uniref:Uncharacterized protein n=1 Tax=Kwoniella europaea PYCC6329 TaxID=1423913 RepID=A0AAX4KD86_9TREE